jgi:K+-sensing histidine kinase KdpD
MLDVPSALCADRIGVSGVHFSANAMHSPRKADPVLRGLRRTMVNKVITNLIENAIGPARENRSGFDFSGDIGKARLKDRDEGIGIAPNHWSRIFERFERARVQPQPWRIRLGSLDICRTIVEALAGSISVQSEQGLGSTFTVETRCAIVEDPDGNGVGLMSPIDEALKLWPPPVPPEAPP